MIVSPPCRYSPECVEGVFCELRTSQGPKVSAGRLVGIDAPKSETLATGGTKIAHNILFVEYHRAFRQSASYLMDQEPDLEVVSRPALWPTGAGGWKRGA